MAQSQGQQYPMPSSHSQFPSPLQPPPASMSLNNYIQPHKRQRVNSPSTGQQPQPSPYNQSPYAGGTMSPSPSPSTASASPMFPNVALPQNAFQGVPQNQSSYTTPYATNGNGNSNTLSLPQTPTGQQNQPQYQPTSFLMPNQIQNNQPQNFSNYGMNTPGAGTMGPPSKPGDKAKEDGIDPMDVLGGTGVDLREEEQYSFNMMTSFNSQLSGSQSGNISSGHSFTQFPPGDKASFFGAGPANAAAERVNFSSQEEFHQHAANKAWEAAATNLAQARSRELANPFLQVGLMHAKMQKIARENGLTLNTEKNGMMGHMKLPEMFENKDVKIKVQGNQEGLLMVTSGAFVPGDSMLVDQLAFLSIATKHRLRGLVEDATKLAKGRQTGSHGIIPEEWADVGAPITETDSSIVTEGALRSGWESAVSPSSNPLKRSFSEANKMPTPGSDGGKPSGSTAKTSGEVASALRESAKAERNFEEARLKRRLARNNGETVATPRAGSIIPGTPGSVAPEASEGKAPTKKEQKKKAEAKINEAASHAAANVTTAQFLGGGSSLFGKKKKGYSWMTGGSGSGASTPGRLTAQGIATPAVPTQPTRLTADGARRLGSWREDGDKGKKIQMRDWITVLEEDGRDKRSLQKAYMHLDSSEPTGK